MIHKASKADAGCLVSSDWGQYIPARVVEIASSYGYGSDGLAGADKVIALADEYLKSGYVPGMGKDFTDDEYDRLVAGAEEAQDWLNYNVAPEGYHFGWYDGEFFLQSDAWWQGESS